MVVSSSSLILLLSICWEDGLAGGRTEPIFEDGPALVPAVAEGVPPSGGEHFTAHPGGGYQADRVKGSRFERKHVALLCKVDKSIEAPSGVHPGGASGRQSDVGHRPHARFDLDPLGSARNVDDWLIALRLFHKEPDDRIDGRVFLQQVEASLGQGQLAVQVRRHEHVSQGVSLERTTPILSVGIELVSIKKKIEKLKNEGSNW